MATTGKIFGLLACILLWASCDKKERNCTDIACTENFAMLSICISNADDDSALVLDYFTSVLTLTNDTLVNAEESKSMIFESIAETCAHHYYASDAIKNKVKNQSAEVEFKGYLNDTLVTEELFIISADCCHISLVNGKQKISIQ